MNCDDRTRNCVGWFLLCQACVVAEHLAVGRGVHQQRTSLDVLPNGQMCHRRRVFGGEQELSRGMLVTDTALSIPEPSALPSAVCT